MKQFEYIRDEWIQKLNTKGYRADKNVTIKIDDVGRFYKADVVGYKEGGRITENSKIVILIGHDDETDIKRNVFEQLGYKVQIVAFHKILEDGTYICACGHKWKIRTEKPVACPNCKNYLAYAEA